MERLVHIELFGQDFSFYTDASEEDVERIVSVVRQELGTDVSGAKAPVPSNKMLVLCCLQIAARCVQAEKDLESFRSKQDETIDKIIGRVSSELE